MTDLFEEKAKDWDANDMIKALSSAIGASMLENVTFQPTMEVLDFGAGTGLITSQVAARVNKVTAVDVSQAMLDKLTAKQDLNGKVETLCQNIVEQPIGKTFDVIVSAMAMHHVEDTDAMVKSFAEHLKPGAQVALADLDAEDGTFHPEGTEGVFHDGFAREALQAVLEKNGFSSVKFVTAHTIQKEEKTYPVFLTVATKA